MGYTPNVMDGAFVLLALLVAKLLLGSKRSGSPLPPGPKGLPLVGNLFDMPPAYEWKTFAKWGEQYGGVCSVRVPGQTIIIVNSGKVALEMLNKKSSIYSDRPSLTMSGELVGWKDITVLLPYGDRFRRARKLFHTLMGTPEISKQYHPQQEAECRKFLRRILNSPERLQEHIRKSTGAVVVRMAYGYNIKEERDPIIELAEATTENFALSTAPGGFMVDLIPALRHVPDWFPGAGFKTKAKEWRGQLEKLTFSLYDYVKDEMKKGEAELSFTSTTLESKEHNAEEESDLMWAASSFFTAGSDTTVSAQSGFFLAMTLFPEVAKKAQAELDSVIGTDRLPEAADRKSLPYIDALVKEVVRWNTVTPTGLAHMVTQDDVYDGYLIPKGALVITNIWAMTHDPQTYKDPTRFNPDRFLGENPEVDPRNYAFGFGRRICPGIHLADTTLFMTCASVLATMNITNYVDANGKIDIPVHENTSGSLSHPKPFKCTIKPRSVKAEALIKDAATLE